MELHDAVKKARKELGLSQQKVAELAGIQRRQLATLERGGNVTLATVRKVIAQLPNMESFMVDTVWISPGRTAAAMTDSLVAIALAMYSAVISTIAQNLLSGIDPGPNEVAMLDHAHEGLKNAISSQSLAKVIAAQETAADAEDDA